MSEESAEDQKKAEKRARSEAQRVESIRLKRELEKQRQSVVAAAPQNKKIKFTFSDDESDTEVTAPSTKHASEKKPQLFGGSDDDEDEEWEEDEEGISNRHMGKKGEKLMKLEARFGNDSRFQMNDKFASSGSEDEGDDDGMAEEKRKHRELLSKVLGKTVKQQQKTVRTDKKAPPRPFTRFDPENEEHVKWMNEFGGGNKKAEKAPEPEKVEKKKTSEPERKVDGQFFQMDSGFAEELKAKMAESENGTKDSSGGFSFLSMIGRSAPETTTAAATHFRHEEEIIQRPDKKMRRMLGHADSDEEDTRPIPSTGKKTLVAAPSCSKFFLTGEEEQVRSVVANFRRTQTMKKMVEKWSTYRDSIDKIYHNQKKAARKNQKFTPVGAKPQNGQKPYKNKEKTATVQPE